jgi:hypothetical protein
MDARPENVVLLTGLPSSGATALAGAIAAHSRVEPLIEPYRRRDEDDYRETDPELLCADFGIELRPGGSLLVGVTADQPGKVELALECLDRAASQDLRAAVIVMVRSPVAAFVDQGSREASLSGADSDLARRLDDFWQSARLSLGTLGSSLARFARRVVLYDRLIEQPQIELARVMALFPYKLEPPQLQVDLGAGLTVDLQAGRAEGFRNSLPDSSTAQHMLRVDELIATFQANAHHDDRAILDQLLLAIDRPG